MRGHRIYKSMEEEPMHSQVKNKKKWYMDLLEGWVHWDFMMDQNHLAQEK
jgi:hypothetical protein